jgi:hypothetical protein
LQGSRRPTQRKSEKEMSMKYWKRGELRTQMPFATLVFINLRRETICEIDCPLTCVSLEIYCLNGQICVWRRVDDLEFFTGAIATLSEAQRKAVWRIEGLGALKYLREFHLSGSLFKSIDAIQFFPGFDTALARVSKLSIVPRARPLELLDVAPSDLAREWRSYLNRRRKWILVHGIVRDHCMALMPLDLPAYVLLWLCDWLPNVAVVTEIKKIRLIENLIASRRRVLAARDAVVREPRRLQ